MDHESRLNLTKIQRGPSAELSKLEMPEAACALPSPSEDRAQTLVASFLKWRREQRLGSMDSINPADLERWAAESGVDLDPQLAGQLMTRAAKELLKLAAEEQNPFFLTVPRSSTAVTDMLRRQVAFEKERAENDKQKQESELLGPIVRSEREKRSELEHREVRAITNRAPMMCDAMAIAPLEMRLRTKQVAPEDIPGVEHFLSDLKAELAKRLESRDRNA